MWIEKFFKEVTNFPDLILITKKEGVVSEVRGKFTAESGEEWLTLKNEGCRCHIHLKTAGLSDLQFVRSQNKEGREMFAIEIMGKEGELILKVSYPTKSDIEGSRSAFEKLEKKYEKTAVKS